MDHSLEDYDDYEEYEDDDQVEEEEEEYEEVEAPKPTKEELEYLALRQKLKEQIRKQTKKDGNSCMNSNYKKLPYDNFGSFFGPSQPVISQRVIQESKSLLENQHLASRVSNHVHGNKKSHDSKGAASKPRGPPRVFSEKKTKVEKLKDTRDYSFLFSEDAHFPAPVRESSSQSVNVLSTEARSAHVPMKNKHPMANSSQHIHGGHKDKKSVSMNGQILSKNKLASLGNINSTTVKPKKQMDNNYRNVAGRPVVNNNGNGAGRPVGNIGNGAGRPVSNNGYGPGRPVGHNNGNGPGRPMGHNNGNGPGRPVGHNNGNGPGRPVGPKAPSATVQRKPSLPSTKNLIPGVNKLPPSRQLADRRNEMREPVKGKLAPNQPVASSKPQINKLQRPISSRPALSDPRPKKRPVRHYSDDEDDDEGGKAISLIRKMFGYNPAKFSRDDDDSDMEANFEDIMREEKRSAKIARKEDEEQLRLIQEEEEREKRARLRRLKKPKA